MPGGKQKDGYGSLDDGGGGGGGHDGYERMKDDMPRPSGFGRALWPVFQLLGIIFLMCNLSASIAPVW
jgi:hypothetical protein